MGVVREREGEREGRERGGWITLLKRLITYITIALIMGIIIELTHIKI